MYSAEYNLQDFLRLKWSLTKILNILCVNPNLLIPTAIPIEVGFDVKLDGPFLPDLGFLGQQTGDRRKLLSRLEHSGRIHLHTR